MKGLTILQVVPTLAYGGVERYVIDLSSALTARGHRVIIASSGGPLLAEAKAAGVAHVFTDISGVNMPAGVARLAYIIDREHVDLVNAHNWRAGTAGFLAARLAKIPYAFTVHGLRDPLQRFVVFYWGPRVITVSPPVREHLVHKLGLSADRVVTSAIGVDTDRFHPQPPVRALYDELGLDPSAPKILHVSRFSRGKAEVALRLIDAAAEIDRGAPGFQMIIAGEGPLEREVASRAGAANRALGRNAIRFAGPRGDVAGLMSITDVVVGTALVALEGMASGKPVIAAGKAGFVGAVRPDTFDAALATWFGDHAQLAPTTPANLGREVVAVLRDPVAAAAAGEFGRQTALRTFTLPAEAADMERIYRSILAPARPVRRVAVFHLNQVGDLIFSLPTLAALRARFPEATITSIVRPYLAELLRDSPYVDDLILRRGGAAAEMALSYELRRKNFDLVVALSQSASTVLQALASRAPTRVGFVDADFSSLLTRRIHVRGVPWPGKFARLAVCLGADNPREQYVGMLAVSDEVRGRARQLLESRGIAADRRVVVLAPGASGRRRFKTWEAHKFAEVGDHLHDRRQAAVVIVGGGADKLEAERIAASMAAPSVNLAGATTTGELVAILERADLLVGIDSGPMHVAAAVGTPTVALFGPTDASRTGPHGDGHVVLTAGLPCSPCDHGCEARTCMTAITAEQVIAAAERSPRLAHSPRPRA